MRIMEMGVIDGETIQCLGPRRWAIRWSFWCAAIDCRCEFPRPDAFAYAPDSVPTPLCSDTARFRPTHDRIFRSRFPEIRHAQHSPGGKSQHRQEHAVQCAVGLRALTGNYPGCTVEKKVGKLVVGGTTINLVDLPGTYSLAPRSLDEMVAVDVLLGRRSDTPAPDGVVCILDASNLERNLYVVSQVLDLACRQFLC